MKAQIVISNGYINRPLEDALITVVVEIRLPAEGGLLVKELQFGHKLAIFGENLKCNWGCARDGENEYRYKRYEVHGDNFSEVVESAIEIAKKELAKIQKALMERREKIRKAGNFESKIVNIQL